ncbi:FMN-dependent NADH-azoreductase [Sphingomonas panacis]|uniref:FMN dependent NADH:quinone oxidoreductase n=1 Tax=Sphingomonas panacis TaxID=1560345 RepID=A0A1B3ZBT2_9SPHN|nr:NAD(P)H-dependent oxidoreductase [Sphingomonas panacis]AOH84882.1 FMN-dependent NADH-azoreductase [Sphingomonas panacis]
MKLLQIDSSITGASSVSRPLTEAVVAKLVAADPATAVTKRDLAAAPLPHLDLASYPGGESEAAAASSAILEEFLAADVVVIGAPMYNFTIPSQLKAWIDRVVVRGRTFSYGPDGVTGLIPGKRIIIVVSRGNFYGPGAPAAVFEHLETLLGGVFGFLGAPPEFVIAEGVAAGPEHLAAALDSAHQAIDRLAA